MSRHLALAEAVDALYRAVIEDPAAWTEERYLDWMADVGTDGVPAGAAKHLRAAMRMARKLETHYRSAPLPPGDWQSAVDVAVGIPAWRPGLALLEAAWNETQDSDIEERLAVRFKMVMHGEWSGNR